MDSSLYKDLTVSRGIKYHYYYSAPQDDKPTLLLCHGFPNSSRDWKQQVAYFKNEGYGVLVPDMMGYAGTDAPDDTALYAHSLISKDLVDLLDAEKVEKAIGVGHDWGSLVVSRLANYFPDRFLGFAFLAVGYLPPRAKNTFMEDMAKAKAAFGYEPLGYQLFFMEPDAADNIEAHWDSFVSHMWAKDHSVLRTHFAPLGVFKPNLLADVKHELADFVTPEDLAYYKETIGSGKKINGGLQWYRLLGKGIDLEDNKAIPPASIPVTKPVFFGAADKDYVCLAPLHTQITSGFCSKLTIKHFDAGHWVLVERPNEVNQELLAWIKDL